MLYDTLKEEYESEDSLARVIERNERRQDVRKGFIVKGLKITNIASVLTRLKSHPNIHSNMEYAQREMHEIIVEFALHKLPYRNFLSATAQLMLIMAPVAVNISHNLPYIKWETDISCKLRDLFDDLFSARFITSFEEN